MATAHADYASADLDVVEVGVLHALASLRPATNADIAEFVAGFVGANAPDVVPALFALDSLGWCAPANNTNPTVAESWFITSQGRVALASMAR